jgi:acetyl-CoA C-acetyltransferase
MRDVAIIGVGSTPFGKLEGRGLIDIAVAACREALADARVPREKIQALYVGNFIGERLASQGAIAGMVANGLGGAGIPATKTEGACASGGIALRLGVLGIALGLYDFVLAAGAEKMTSAATAEVTAGLATAGDEEAEMRSGLTFPGSFGIVTRAHMARHGTTREQIGLVSVKNHGLGTANPKAQFRKPVTLDEVLRSRLIADPLRLFDCPPISDGAAAVVLCPADRAPRLTPTRPRMGRARDRSGHALGDGRDHVVPRDRPRRARGLRGRGDRARRRRRGGGPRLLHHRRDRRHRGSRVLPPR